MIGLIFNTKDEVKTAILDNIKNVSINAAQKVDTEFQKEINGIVDKLSNVYWILNFITNYTDKEINEIKFDSKMILWQGANSILGALQLIRIGYL